MNKNNKHKLSNANKQDKQDLNIANEAYKEYIKRGKQSKPISELWQELNL